MATYDGLFKKDWYKITPEEVDARIEKDKAEGKCTTDYDPDKSKGFDLPERNTIALERIAHALEQIVDNTRSLS